MQLSEIKEIKNLVDDDWRDAVERITEQEDDFCSGNFRFIRQDAIDKIQQDELSGDEYMLGCFTDWFLADVLDLDIDVIEAMQKAEAFEALGKMVLSMDKLEELQQSYMSADGYGHHFNHYDGAEEELGEYYYFRVD
jgi:hypothetical protein